MAAKELAEWVLSHGRYFLRVGGIYVVMETDLCRDPRWTEKVWTGDMIKEAAAIINKEAQGVE